MSIFVPVPIALFFFSSWLTMVFWGIIAPDLGIPTISYPKAMLITIALWLVVAPAILALRPRWWRWRSLR